MVKKKFCTNLLKAIDMFGPRLNLNLKGREKQGTKLGGVTTILTSILLTVYAGFLLKRLALTETVTKQTETIYLDLDRMPPLMANEISFDVAVLPIDQNQKYIPWDNLDFKIYVFQ